MQTRYYAAIATIGLSFLALMSSADAKDKELEAPPKVFGDLQSCRAIADEKARLACFDTVSAQISQQVESKELVLLDRVAVKNTKKSLFGFSIPDVDFLKDEEGQFEFEKLETTVTSVASGGYRKLQFRVAEGSLWRTTEASDLELKNGQKIVLSKGSLGGYFVKVGSARSVRAVRVE